MSPSPRALVLLAAWATAGLAQEPAVEVPASAYALVDGVAIERDAVDAMAKESDYPPAVVLESLIHNAAVEHGLRTAGNAPGAVTAEQIEAKRKELRREWSAEEVAKVKDRLLRLRIAFGAHLESLIDEDRLRAYYEERSLLLNGEVRARHVQFPATARGLHDAQAAIASLGTDPEDEAVDRLARERSVDPFGPVNGGDLDWFGSDGHTPLALIVPRPLSQACFDRGKPGLVPYPVASRVGYHVLYVISVRVAEDGGFEAEAPRLRRALERQLARETEQAWRREARVVYAADAPRISRR